MLLRDKTVDSHRPTFWADIYPHRVQDEGLGTPSAEVPSSSPPEGIPEAENGKPSLYLCPRFWPLCCGNSSPTLCSFPHLKKQSCRASVYHEREQLPTQGLCLISRTSTVIKASKKRGLESERKVLPVLMVTTAP